MAQTTAPQETSKKAPGINFDVPKKKLTPETVQPTTPPLLEKPKARWPKYLLFGILGLLIGAALGVLALKFL